MQACKQDHLDEGRGQEMDLWLLLFLFTRAHHFSLRSLPPSQALTFSILTSPFFFSLSALPIASHKTQKRPKAATVLSVLA